MTFTMLPGSPRCFMSAIAACMRKNGARRFTAMCWSNSSGVVSSMVPRVVSPAALTRQSIRPCRWMVAATEACAAVTSLTSVCTKLASAPVFCSSATTFSPRSALRPEIITAAPSRALARAIAAPRPWVPPLISTTFPVSRSFMRSMDISSLLVPTGVGDRGRPGAGEHIEDSLGRVDIGGGAALPAHSHQVRGEHDVGVIEQRVVCGRFGVEDIQPHTAEPAVLQRRVDGVEIGESAAAAVDQDRTGFDVAAVARSRPGGGWSPAAAGAR